MMKMANLQKLMVVALLWLTYGECQAQKLTPVSEDYCYHSGAFWYNNQEVNYDNGNSFFYQDINMDGKLEVLIHQGLTYIFNRDTIRTTGIRWIDTEGNSVKEEPTLSINPEKLGLMEDINGDGIVDFVCRVNGNSNITFFLSKDNSYERIETPSIQNNYAGCYSPCIIDINHDGLKDLLFYRKNAVGYAYIPAAYIQTANHRFFYQDLEVVTDEKELENANFSTGGNGAFTVSGGVSSISVANGMFAKAPMFDGFIEDMRRVAPLGEQEKNDIIVADINNDGYPDVITNIYPTLLSLPDGRYYAGSLKGKVVIVDINNDGLKDIIMFSAGSVWLYTSRSDGEFDSRKLIDNGSITGMYCQDFNCDGLTDIMLQAASNEYSFIVFYKNKGEGEFSKKENMLNGRYLFSKPYDFENNGKASVMACKVTLEKSENTPLKHLIWDDNFKLTEIEVIHENKILYIPYQYNQYDANQYEAYFRVADFDGDGILEIICNTGSYTYNYIINYHSYLYSPFSPSPNTAPEQMPMPNVIYDKQSGSVKIEWPLGSDKETSASDLTYTVRMGAEEDKQNLMVYNAGASRYCVADAGLWDKGKVYVSVRATDANGKFGEWSPEATFTVETQRAGFTYMTKDQKAEYLTTADTLVVRSTNGKQLTYSLPNDGKVIMQESDSAYIVFSSYGEKTIEASYEGANKSLHTIQVMPLKAIKTGVGFRPDVFIDLDGDGLTEGVKKGMASDGYGNNLSGLYAYEDNEYKKLGTMFNSDIKAIDEPVFMDYTMNGLPDIYSNNGWSINKNGTTYHWILNRGDLDFEVEKSPVGGGSKAQYLDLNNDGLMDYVESGTYFNKGDFTFEKKIIPTGIYVDIDKDGLLDVVQEKYSPNRFIVNHNKGNLEFEQISEIILEDGERWENKVMDINNDGYPDCIVSKGTFRDSYNREANDYQSYAYLGSKDMTFTERIELPGKPLLVDLDNNGYVDYLIAGETDLHSRKGDYIFAMGEADGFSTLSCPSSNFGSSRAFTTSFLTDINNDGKPDNPNSEYYKILQSAFTNNAPTAPTLISVAQDNDFVVVSWTGARDKETPNMALRYNLSIKEKGAKGDGSYIISPLNQTKDEAKAIDNGTMQYRYATRFPIPFSRFTAGKTYEVQVQTIDGWCEHSPFSKVVEFTPTAQVLFTMPEKAGVGQKVPFTLKDNSGDTADINTDGGTIDNNTIIWTTSGVKTISVTAGGVTTSRQILIVDKPDLTFSIPTKMLSGSMVTITLPADFYRADAVTTLTSNSKNVSCVVNEGKGVVVMPSTAGNYNVTINYEDDVFGKLSETNTVEIVDFTPEISQVSVKSDGCLIQWSKDMGNEFASLLTGKVKVYRETSIAGKYDVIGETRLTDGKYMDRTARPDVKSCRYLLTVENNYGSESQSSRIHASVLLMANHGLGNDVNLHWNGYIGAQVATYRIYAGSSRENLQQIDEVSGNTLSYIHHRSNDDRTFYAIAYTLNTGQSSAALMHRAALTDESQSNIICSDEAYNVTLVQGISVYEKDGLINLDGNTNELHMQAIVTPALATLSRVEWSIIAGNDLAEIDQKGTLKICDNENGGIVTVQARAIDGSEVFGTMNITVAPYHTTDIRNANLSYIVPIIGISNGRVYINNVRNTTDVMILTVTGAVTYHNKIVADTCIHLTKGIYIVKVGEKAKKVYIK